MLKNMKTTLIIITLFFVYIHTIYGQSNSIGMTYKGKFLGKAKSAEIISTATKIHDAEIEKLFESLKFEGVIYMLDDGRILDYEPGEKIGSLWPSKEDFLLHLRRLATSSKSISGQPLHVLSGFTLLDKDFPERVPGLLAELGNALKFDPMIRKGNACGMDEFNVKLLEYGLDEARNDLFIALVAYSGEFMRIETGGQWEMEFDTETGVWEPYIKLESGRTFNPWLHLYKELQDNPDGFDFRSVVESELGKYLFVDAGLMHDSIGKGVKNIPVQEALTLLEDLVGEVDPEIDSLMRTFGLSGLPIRLLDGRYLIRQSVYYLPLVPLFETKQALQDFIRLHVMLMQVQNSIPRLQSLEEAMLSPETVRHLHVSLSDLELPAFDPSLFINLEMLSVAIDGWTVFPPAGIAPDLPIVNWSVLCQFSSIKTLDLSDVPIATLPEEIRQLLNLETLQLFFFLPKDIGQEIAKLQQLGKLKVLDLERSMFETGQQDRIVAELSEVVVVESSNIPRDSEPGNWQND